MNNKVVSIVLVLGIASTGFAGISAASSGTTLTSTGVTNELRTLFGGKSQMQARRAKHKAVIDALIAGQSLTADQEATRLDLLAKMQDDTHPRRDGGDIIEKLLAGDELTADEKAELVKMQELRAAREAEKAKIAAMNDTERETYLIVKKAEMEAKMQTLKPLFEKKKTGETLTADEQAQLDAFKAEYPMMKEGKRGHKGGHKEGKMEK